MGLNPPPPLKRNVKHWLKLTVQVYGFGPFSSLSNTQIK